MPLKMQNVKYRMLNAVNKMPDFIMKVDRRKKKWQ